MNFAYSRLYLRTAAHIGIALAAFVLIGAASLGLIAAWELQGYIETRDSSLGEAAATILAEGGEPALIEWMNNEAEIPADVSVYILNSKSEDILGRELPEQYKEFVKESVVGLPAQPDSRYEPARLAPRLTAADGTTYSFLVLPKGISLWGSPATSSGLIIAAVFVIAVVAWLIARTIGKPVSQLQITVRELASGNTAARVPDNISTRNDELGSLAADFNIMADQLTHLMDERENLMQEMSHELRSPLTRLHAAIALITDNDSLDDKARNRIEQEISRMNLVVGEILRYSSLKVAAAPRKKLVRICKLLQELCEIEDIETGGKNCRIQLNTHDELTVIGDPELLRIGYENILRNAIRFAPEGSTIYIDALLQNGSVVVSIEDQGPGVPADEINKIFEPYFRAKGAEPQTGSGLGMAIVKRVFETHNGQVRATRGRQSGLKIIMTLPAAEVS